MTSSQRNASCQPQIVGVSHNADNLQLRTNAWYKPIHNVDATGLAVSWTSGLKVLRLMKPRCKIDAMVNMMKNLLPVPQVQHTAMEKLQISKVSRFVVFKNLVSKTFKALPIRARHKMLPKKMNFTLLSSFRRRQVAQKAFLVTGLLLLTLCCDRLLVFGSQLAVLCIYALLDKSLPAKEKGSSYSRRCDLVF